MTDNDSFLIAAGQLINAGRFIDNKNWVPATSGNFSVRLPDNTVAITVSGKHKGQLQIDDIMRVDLNGDSLDGKRPSAETLLHTTLYQRFPEINSVLHPHPLNTTLISRLFKDEIVLENYELLKAFAGITTHESRINVPIFANDQNIERLAQVVNTYLDTLNNDKNCYGYIIASHGLYTWGVSVSEALRYLEAFDFLFASELYLKGKNP
ncbi:MAG: methylthioribulose 1-phosphate dehydratase [Methylococcaceae bacterium]